MSEKRKITTINHRGHVRPVENTFGDADPRPGDAEYLTALAPPNNSLLPTNGPSGVPLPSDDDPYRVNPSAEDAYQREREAVERLQAELAEAKAALAFEQKKNANAEVVRLATLERYEQKDKENTAEIKELQAALGRERELSRRAKNPCIGILDHKWLDPVCVEKGCQSLFLKEEREARLRLDDEVDALDIIADAEQTAHQETLLMLANEKEARLRAEAEVTKLNELYAPRTQDAWFLGYKQVREQRDKYFENWQRAEAGSALVRLATEALLKARQGCHSCNPVGALDHPIAELRVAVSSTDAGATVEARLAALEAQRAVMRRALELAILNECPWCGTCTLPDAVSFHATDCPIAAALATDTGARLAAVLEEVRKMPCEYGNSSICGTILNDKTLWCLRCRLVDAMETPNVP